MSIMSCYYQPVSEEVKCFHITCHAGTESESGYSHSQTLTFKLDGGGAWIFKAMPQLFPLGKLEPIAIPSMLPQPPSEKVI
jgi:hypothetical protein